MAHGENKGFSSPTFFCNGREHIAFSHGQKLLSNHIKGNLSHGQKLLSNYIKGNLTKVSSFIDSSSSVK